MKIILHKSFGQIEIETASDKEAIMQASFWSELPDVCPLCDAGVHLHYRETKEQYEYFELHCGGQPSHRTQFGQYKSGGFYYKRDSWEVRTHQNLLQADREEFDRQQPQSDHDWKSERPTTAGEFADDEQIQTAFSAIRSRLGEPWHKKPDETRDQYLDRLRRQYKQIVEMQAKNNELSKTV